MKLFHPNYSGSDVGVGGKQYRVERAGNGGVYVNVPDEFGPLLFEHGFRGAGVIDIDAVARDAIKTRASEENGKKAAARTRD